MACVNVITGPGGAIGEAMVAVLCVDKVAFTGETTTGLRIMQIAAQTIKKVTLELGGKSPNIVFPDADLRRQSTGLSSRSSRIRDSAARHERDSSFTRTSTNRFWHRLVARRGRSALVIHLSGKRRWDRSFRRSSRNESCRICGVALGEGAQLLTGGRRVTDGEWPQVISSSRRSSAASDPTCLGAGRGLRADSGGDSIRDEDEVVRMANSTIYGLAATIWTKDIKRAHTMAPATSCRKLSHQLSDGQSAEAPFGGYKQSGIGSGVEPARDRPLHAGQERGR